MIFNQLLGRAYMQVSEGIRTAYQAGCDDKYVAELLPMCHRMVKRERAETAFRASSRAWLLRGAS